MAGLLQAAKALVSDSGLGKKDLTIPRGATLLRSSGGFAEEAAPASFDTYVERILLQSSTVASLVFARQFVLGQGRFAWFPLENGRMSPNPFGTPELEILEKPWAGGSSMALISQMEAYAMAAGNHYSTVVDDRGMMGREARGPNRRIKALRPDRVWVLTASTRDGEMVLTHPETIDSRLIGYRYESPDGTHTYLTPDQVAHYAPHPHPSFEHIGMSWITPGLDDIMGDQAAVKHKKRFFENAATPRFVVSLKEDIGDDGLVELVDEYRAKYEGPGNAYRTVFFTNGADIKPLTTDFKALEFATTQGKTESRIAALAGVPSAWVGFSEGLAGSGFNQGSYESSRRRFADGTVRPLWQAIADAMSVLVTPPRDGVKLGIDTSNAAFLREDATERASVLSVKIAALARALDSGFKPDAAISTVMNEDLSRLIGEHSGKLSVQLQEMDPKSVPESNPEPEPQNGD